MLTVKCPHCATALKLSQAPPSGKVKCPKCAKILSVGGPKSAAGRPAPAPSALHPDDEGFDFGRIQFPAASGSNSVENFPVSSALSQYAGPIPGDPLQWLNEDGVDPAAGAAGEPGGAKKKKRGPVIWIVAIVLLLLLVGGGVAAAFLLGAFG